VIRQHLSRWRQPVVLGLWALGLLALLAGCGGGGSSANSSIAPTTASYPASAAKLTDSNVMAISVESGPGNNVNIPYVTVTVCSPGGTLGSSSCKTIDHVLLDTGSTGLRLFATQLSVAPALTLPPQTVGSNPAISAISECANFLNNNAWGSIKLADVVLGGERATNVPIQLMDANDAHAVNCWNPNTGPSLFVAASDAPKANSQTLSANGILGLSLFTNDGQSYFNCTLPGSACVGFNATKTQQVQNPVGLLGISSSNGVANKNGVIVQLPAIAAQGVGIAPGYLVFGVGTQANNQLGSANVLRVNAFGQFTTVFGVSLPASFIDSGSNGLYFPDASLSTSCSTAASGFYCPPSTRNLTATIQLGGTGGNVNVDFSIANADQLFSNNGISSGNYAFNNLGGKMTSNAFDWGLPFFFGRSVYTVIEGKTVGTMPGPFYAFTN